MSETVSLAGRPRPSASPAGPIASRPRSAGPGIDDARASAPGADVDVTGGRAQPVPKGLPMSAATRAVWTGMARLPARSPVVAVTAAAGGVGVSTVTAALGALLALALPESASPVAIDASTRAWSGLPARVGAPCEATFNDLLAHEGPEAIPRDRARAYMRRGPTGLEMIAAEHRPGAGAVRPPMTAGALYRVLGRLRGAYPLLLVDAPAAGDAVCEQTLRRSDVLVVVARASTDGVEQVLSFLGWMRDRGHGRMGERAVVVVDEVAPGPPREVRAGERMLARQAGAVLRLPYDRALARPEPAPPTVLGKATRGALLEIAAAVVAGWDTKASASAGTPTSEDDR